MTTWGAEDGEWENNQDEVTGGASPARPARCHGQQLIAREHDETAGRTVRTVRKGVILKHYICTYILRHVSGHERKSVNNLE